MDKKNRQFILAALLVWQSCTFAADVDAGLAAFNAGDFKKAFQEWQPLAQKGNAAAQHNLASLYDEGRGVPQDFEKAITLYRKAAEQGYLASQHNLAVRYSNGQGVKQDNVGIRKKLWVDA